MKYIKHIVGDGVFMWSADPSNWEELRYTLHNEEPFLTYDPNNVPDNSDILKLF